MRLHGLFLFCAYLFKIVCVMQLCSLCLSSSRAGCGLWNMLPRKAVDTPVLRGVQSWVGYGLGQPDLVCGNQPSVGDWNWVGFKVPLQPKLFIDSMIYNRLESGLFTCEKETFRQI